MPSETQTLSGTCPTHGSVEATRQVPQAGFPFLINAVRRQIAARRRPYLCPTCGARVEPDAR